VYLGFPNLKEMMTKTKFVYHHKLTVLGAFVLFGNVQVNSVFRSSNFFLTLILNPSLRD
jgi:hypothetical protein